ncbi:MAG: metal ABC transporter substrate-binding protein [Trueperaceae bacterium]
MRIRSRQGVSRLLATCLALFLLTPAAARPNVVVSIHPLYDLVRQIAGDDADVVRLLAPGASPHTFDPTPRDVARIVAADLVVMNGGLDLWLRNLVEASGARAPVLELIGLEAVRGALRESFPDLVTADAGGASYGFNPHVWLDPLVMAAALPDLARALADVDAAAADRYLARAEALVADLEALHRELAAGLAPLAGVAFVPFHDAWPYFAARYGLDLVVEIEPFPGREPSPAYLRTALGLIRDSGARVIFGEAQLERRPAEVVAAEAGVALAILDPLGGVPERDGYQELLRWNAAVLLESLR